jgi:RNA polymerase sigma-70 factor (ECF subfamily)
VDECLDRYGGLVWSLARRLSPSLADAEDAVQEIFVDLWRSADRFRPEVAEEATFVATLARRRLIDRLRKFGREGTPQPLDSAAFEQPALPKSAPVELAEEAARAADCLERLRAEERQVIELSVYQGLSQTRIAERLATPLGTVKTHATRGLTRLRDCMGVGKRQRKGAAVP